MKNIEKLINWKQKVAVLLIVIAIFVIVLAKNAGFVGGLNVLGLRQKPMAAPAVGRLADLHIPANEISAEAVMAEIMAAGPFQTAREVARFYEDANVDWTLPLASVDKQPGGMSLLKFQTSGEYASGVVVVTVPTKELDGIEVIRPNGLVRVRGTIESADNGSVILKDASVVQSAGVAVR